MIEFTGEMRLNGKAPKSFPRGSEVFGSLFDSALKAKQNVSKRIAERVAELAKEVLEKQVYRSQWEDLSETYSDWKERQNLDPRTLISTGEYLDSIKARVRHYPTRYFVGPDPEATHKDSGLPFKKLMRMHEYGFEDPARGVRIPARPFWRPFAEEVRIWIEDEITTNFKLEVMANMKRDYPGGPWVKDI